MLCAAGVRVLSLTFTFHGLNNAVYRTRDPRQECLRKNNLHTIKSDHIKRIFNSKFEFTFLTRVLKNVIFCTLINQSFTTRLL